ncbi:hypothetical protein NBM05_14975 [Rothia sp. AR01]|uniref:Uncharacterized protein n=1 Tax=Rothia santali TaxID=2949643 RepID=A0A9X2HMV7_9MICC|nr:hypothetical protein [Rothia santali]MCP3427273.1 hypothetical protein [Rothia santali]
MSETGDPREPRRPDDESPRPEPAGPTEASSETAPTRTTGEQAAAGPFDDAGPAEAGRADAEPRRTSLVAALGSRLTPADWWGSAIAAGVTYGAMLIVTALASLALIGVVRGELDASMDAYTGQAWSMVSGQFGAYGMIALIFQLVAMAMGGTFTLRLTQSGLGDGETVTASLHAVPLLITLVGLAALFVASRMLALRQVRRDERPGAPALWLSSAVTAVMLVVLTAVLTLIFSGRGSFSAFIVSVTYGFNAFSPQLVLYPLVIGTLVSYWARRSVMRPARGRVSDALGAFAPGAGVAARLTGVYAGCLALLVLVVLSIVAVVEGSASAGLAMLFFGFPLVADALALGHLSGIVTQDFTGSIADRSVSYIWSDLLTEAAGHWPMLLWIPIVLGILLLAVAWSGRRPRVAGAGSWFVMPAVFLLAGIVLVWAGGLRFSSGGFLGEGSYAFGPVWWTPLCLLVWGFAVEALARFAAPFLVRAVPAGARGVVVGSPAVAASAAGDRSAAGGDAAAPATRPVAPAPMSPAARKRLWIAGIVAGSLALLLVLGLGTVRVVNATVYNPEKVVDEYLGAVVDGDVDRAVEVIDPNVASAERALLADAVYSAADQRISGYEVNGVEVGADGETAVADIAVTQDGRTVDRELSLRKAGGSFGLVQWEIDARQPGLYQTIEYEVPEGVDTVTVNGTEVEVPEGGGSSSASPSPTSGLGSSDGAGQPRIASFTVLPGRYEFAAPSGGTYVTYGSDRAVTAGVDGGPQTVAFDQRLTDAALEEAREAANARLDECTRVRAFEVPDCGFDYYDTSRDRNPEWSIETYPEYALSNDSYSSLFSSSQGDNLDDVDPGATLYLVTTKDGEAGLTYQSRSFDDEWEDEDATRSISGYFEVDLSSDQLKLVDSTNSSGF